MKRCAFGTIANNRDGAAAVEFALVAPLFFALVFSIIEAGWFFFVNSAVDQANATAARLIRTGQAQTTLTADQFYTKICNVVDNFGDCEKRLTVDVSRYATFTALAADLSNPQCRNQDDPTIQGAQFTDADYGGQNEIIRVRVCFLYKPINPALGLQLTTNNHGYRELVSLSIFRNEPF